MSEFAMSKPPKHGRLPKDETLQLVEHLAASRQLNAEWDVYTVLWWLADNGWDIVKAPSIG